MYVPLFVELYCSYKWFLNYLWDGNKEAPEDTSVNKNLRPTIADLKNGKKMKIHGGTASTSILDLDLSTDDSDDGEGLKGGEYDDGFYHFDDYEVERSGDNMV
eukprot:g11282.t1